MVFNDLSDMLRWHLNDCWVADRLLLVEAPVLHCGPFSSFCVQLLLGHRLFQEQQGRSRLLVYLVDVYSIRITPLTTWLGPAGEPSSLDPAGLTGIAAILAWTGASRLTR